MAIGMAFWSVFILANEELLAELIAISTFVITCGLFFTWHGYMYDQDADKYILGFTGMLLVFAIGIWLLANIYTGDIYHIDLVNKIICYFTCPR